MGTKPNQNQNQLLFFAARACFLVDSGMTSVWDMYDMVFTTTLLFTTAVGIIINYISIQSHHLVSVDGTEHIFRQLFSHKQ